MKDDDILHKWVNGQLNEEELALFKLRPEYAELEALNKSVDGLEVPAFDQNKMLKEILAEDKEKLKPTPKTIGRRAFLSNWAKYAVAASLLFLIAFWYWPRPENIVFYKIAKGEQKESVFPDESSFVLNADSELKYDAGNWSRNRSVDLKGEAFFDVKKGAKFKVNTPNGNIVVLGTQFNVWARKDILEVNCTSGKVVVSNLNGERIKELIANESVRIQAGEKINEWTSNSAEKSWKDGISKFTNVPLSRVIEALERQYKIKIIVGTIDVSPITSCNFVHNDLNTALKTSLYQMGIEFSIENDQVILSQ